MGIIVRLDVMLAKRKMKLQQLGKLVGKHSSNLSLLRGEQTKGIKFDLQAKICEALDCGIEDILELDKEKEK